jgi:hypothetical protein
LSDPVALEALTEGTTDHAAPFHTSASVDSVLTALAPLPVWTVEDPTAMHQEVSVHDTELSPP